MRGRLGFCRSAFFCLNGGNRPAELRRFVRHRPLEFRELCLERNDVFREAEGNEERRFLAGRGAALLRAFKPVVDEADDGTHGLVAGVCFYRDFLTGQRDLKTLFHASPLITEDYKPLKRRVKENRA